ncbi:ribonuclease P protein component [gut metagenome]|uniref:Ribonuclease P protein component n=1 Tax=gut metagenome TaxID=749906 RepID=J9GUZ5_9ZZZZ
MKQFGFPKAEHLCLQSEISQLFEAGSHSMTMFPLRVVYQEVPYQGGPHVKVLLSVSKRRFKHAVDRNRAKRQLREAYRLHKATLLEAVPETMGLHLAFIWLSDRPVHTRQIQQRVAVLLTRMAEKLAVQPVEPLAVDSMKEEGV